jgi:hypothetical protein
MYRNGPGGHIHKKLTQILGIILTQNAQKIMVVLGTN